MVAGSAGADALARVGLWKRKSEEVVDDGESIFRAHAVRLASGCGDATVARIVCGTWAWIALGRCTAVSGWTASAGGACLQFPGGGSVGAARP